jgi:hypothetical protein
MVTHHTKTGSAAFGMDLLYADVPDEDDELEPVAPRAMERLQESLEGFDTKKRKRAYDPNHGTPLNAVKHQLWRHQIQSIREVGRWVQRKGSPASGTEDDVSLTVSVMTPRRRRGKAPSRQSIPEKAKNCRSFRGHSSAGKFRGRVSQATRAQLMGLHELNGKYRGEDPCSHGQEGPTRTPSPKKKKRGRKATLAREDGVSPRNSRERGFSFEKALPAIQGPRKRTISADISRPIPNDRYPIIVNSTLVPLGQVTQSPSPPYTVTPS